jgi:hypothetical protein
MAIDANIALGVRPVEQPNMLAQMGQMMALRQAQQGYESENAVKNFYAQGGDLSTAEGRRNLMAQTGSAGSKLIGAQSEINARDVKTGMDSLKMLKDNVAVVNTPSDMATYLQNAARTPGGQMLFGVVPLDKALANIPNDPRAFETYKRNFGLTADKLYESADAQLNSRTSLATNAATVGATIRGQDKLDAREREKLSFVETGTGPGLYSSFGPQAGVIRPMSQAPWSPPSGGVTPSAAPMAFNGGETPAAARSSIMVNPSSVNAFAPTTQNGLITQPQPSATAPTGYTQATPKGPASIINVNTQTTASEEAQKQFMQSSRITYDQLKQAPTVLENIEKAKALVPIAKGFMGTGGETMLEAAKFMNNRLGTSIDTAGIKSAEELNSRLFMGIMDNLKKMDAQPSQQQQAAMKQALGNLGTDPNAMNAVLDVFGDIVRGKVDIHNTEVMGAEARGVKFPYNPVIKLKERTPASTGDIATDAGVARVLRTGTFNGRKVIEYSDGKTVYAD